MAVIAKQRYKLDIAPKGGWVIVYASQHDNGAREIEFEITNQGNAYSIPASINISVQGVKSNKGYFSHSCSYSGNIVKMALANDMTDVIGKAICVLKFTNSSQQKLATAKFILNVDSDSSSEGIIIDTEAEEIFNQMLNEIRAQAASVSVDIAELQSMVGSPLVASTASAMTDHNKIYVYTGSQSGYTSGNWYYWNGSAWTSGGVYNAVAFETDKTLSVENMAADARQTGLRFDKISEDTYNIFPISEKRVDGASVQIQSNKITVTSTKSSSGGCAIFFIDVRLISNITISFKKYTGTGSGGIRFANLDANGTFVSWIKWVTDASNVEDTTGKVFTEDVSQVDYLGVMLYAVRSANTGVGNYITYEDVMVFSGTDTRSYMPPLTAKDEVARKAIESIINPLIPVDVVAPVNKSLANTLLWEAGTINNSDGKNANQGNSIRLQKYIAVNPDALLYFQAYYSLPTDRVDVSTTDNYNMRNAYILQYDKDGNYISRISISSDNTLKGSSITFNVDCKYIRIAFYTRLSNADISTIMPSVIYFDEIVGEYWLPPYYDGYLESKAEVIEQYARDAGGDGNIFVFITDEHAPQYSQMRSPVIIHKLAELTHLPILFSGGDVDQNGTKTNEFCDFLRNAYNGEIHHLVGNHDFLNQNTGQSLYYDMDMYNSNQIGSGDHHYYYVDDLQRKTRYVCLAAYMESESALGTGTGTAAQGGYTAEQIAWISNEALNVPSGWSIIVFTHYFYLINTISKVATLSYGSSILGTLSSNSNVIVVFQGHTHFDRIVKGHDETAGSLPVVITSCDKNIEYGGDEGWTVNRSKGTIYEQLFDVVIINKRTRTATMVRIGGLAENGLNDSPGEEAEIRSVTF